MPHSYGYRARTRHLFARPFRGKGRLHLTPYLTSFKIGDHVDIVVNGSIHRGMAHKYYHGKTGKVWNVTPRAVGVEVNKQVKGRIIGKRFHVRIEHVQKSKCREEFIQRVKACNEVKKHNAANPDNKKPFPKRLPAQPRPSHVVKVHNDIQTLEVTPYEDLI